MMCAFRIFVALNSPDKRARSSWQRKTKYLSQLTLFRKQRLSEGKQERVALILSRETPPIKSLVLFAGVNLNYREASNNQVFTNLGKYSTVKYMYPGSIPRVSRKCIAVLRISRNYTACFAKV